MIVIPPPVHKRLTEENENDDYLKTPVKTYRYSLKLEVYEDDPYTIPSKRFMVDTLSVFNNNEYVTEALRKNFEKLLETFIKENE
jgi:hypothetical protein